MPKYRCFACPAIHPNRQREFEAAQALHPVCPRCGASEQAIVRLVDVHFVVADPKGPIKGRLGRYKVACEPGRQYLARSHMDSYAASGEPTAVTCRSCMRTRDYEEMLAVSEALQELREVMAEDYPDLAPKVVTVDMGKR